MYPHALWNVRSVGTRYDPNACPGEPCNGVAVTRQCLRPQSGAGFTEPLDTRARRFLRQMRNVESTALRLDQFPSGVLVDFPSGASTLLG
jgi:hypothetical protein